MVVKVQEGSTLSLITAYEALETIYDDFAMAARELGTSRVAPICVDGCGLCCQVNTPYAWGIEGSYVISDLLGKGLLTQALKASEAWLLDRQRGVKLYGPRVDMTSAAGRTLILEEARLVAHAPCPFLSEDKRCSIHDVRPLACRAYGVTRVPSQTECRAPFGIGESVERRAHYDGTLLKIRVRSFLSTLSAEQRAGYFLPTALLRQARPERFGALEDRFATGKMVAMPESPALLWQDQLEALWKEEGR